MNGGGGKDRLSTEGGANDGFQDIIRGGAGSDTIRGGPSDDQLYGSSGNDIISAGPGQDKVYGEDGNDLLYALKPGADQLFGGPGNDRLLGDFRQWQFDAWHNLSGDSGNDYCDGGLKDMSCNP